MSPAQPERRGFTLIEVLVVVALIALLVSILLPSLRLAREQSKAVVCQSDLRQIMLGLRLYQQDHRGWLPLNAWSEYDWGVSKKNLWFYKLQKKYMPDPKIYICPSDPYGPNFDYNALQGTQPHRNARVPSCGYGLNYVVRHFGEPKSFNIERFGPKRPMATILLAEVGPDSGLENVPLGSNGMGQPWRDGGRLVWDDGARPWYAGPTWLTVRHMGTINMSSMDGAVHQVNSARVLRTRVRTTYEDCARGDCYFCKYHPYADATHYNFSRDRLWWWTGQIPYY
ncbi:MAG: type II secretion system protein [Planctomycetes bacterium]|nr:type II secretion system protein [Planctomycetota bacterium]